MKFHEHIIRVTVPGLPCEVTREELSGELADFAHRPEHFLEEVTKSEVVSPERRGSEPGSIAFERNIYFGHLVFHETVQIGADGSYRSHAAGSGNGRHLTFPCRSKNQSLGNSSSASFISKIAQKCRQQ